MKKIILFIALIVVGPLAQAITLDATKIYQRYITHSDSLRAAKERLKAADALEVEASRKLFPNISLVGSVKDQKTPAALTGGLDITPPNIYSLNLSFSQPLYLGGKIWRAWDLRKLSARRAALDVRNQEMMDLFDLYKKALDLEMQVQYKKEVRESQLTQGQFLGIIKSRYKKGAAKAYEKYQAEADLLSYEGQLIEIDQAIDSLEQSLRQELKIPLEDSISVSMAGENIKEPINFERGLQEALSNRPDYLLAVVNEEVAITNKWIDLGDHLPQVNLEGQFGYTSQDSETLTDEESEMKAVVLSLAIPLFSGLSSVHVRRSAESRITAARYDIKSLENRIRTEVKDAFDNLSRAQTKMKSAKSWKDRSELALNEGVKSYKVGIISSLVVVQLQKAREVAAKSYWAALMNLKVSVLRWRLARGVNPTGL